jgi:Alr-MurF fusion protein
MTIQDIAHVLQCPLAPQADPNAPIEHLLTDSRHQCPPHSLFIALTGQRHDGHTYVQDAYNKGVRHFVVSKRLPHFADLDAVFLYVEMPLRALQQIVALHRSHFNVPIIGITGSNGKTIIKEWLYQLLRPDFDVVRSPKSYNSQLGVPLSVWQMQAHHTLGIFEAGISRPDEMTHLEGIIRPTIGIFTMLGTAHQEGFSSEKVKFLEKMRLFERCPILIGCADQGHEWPEHDDQQLLLWSATKQPATFIQPLSAQRRAVQMRIGEPLLSTVREKHPDAPDTFSIEVGMDDAALENAMHCVMAGLVLGVSPTLLAERVAGLDNVEMRLELKPGLQHSLLVNDAYSLDLVSLRIALQFADQQGRGRKKVLILSDFEQSGLPMAQLWQQVAQLIEAWQVRQLIGIGASIPAIVDYLPAGFEVVFYESVEDMLAHVAQFHFYDRMVIIKGARKFAFERIALRLEQKAHKTVLEINLSALVHNLNVFHSHLEKGTKMMVMVKAAGYGSGAAEIARLLEYHGVDYLGVAYADEGIELREAGVSLPIMVLNPTPDDFDVMFRYQLEPEIYSLELFQDVSRFATPERPIAIHLKLDTGMHRLGLSEADIRQILPMIQAKSIKIQSVFSHLAASDAPDHDAFTIQQCTIFDRISQLIIDHLDYRPLRHIVNTGGIIRWPQYHFDMVRLGIGLYGAGVDSIQSKLQTVLTLKATISQIHEVPAGDTVGYSRNSGPLESTKRIATISIGYADGLLRLAGGGRYKVLIHNKLAPTIGNICMDMTMIDVTHIPKAQVGDMVVVFGDQPTVQALADTLQTIPYEVFTSISGRVKRVYVQE